MYSVATGAVLHAWSSPADQFPPIDGDLYSGGDSNTTIAWVGERGLAYNEGTRTSRGLTLEVEVLSLSRPDGDLLGSSRTAAVLPAPNRTGSPHRSGATGSGTTS